MVHSLIFCIFRKKLGGAPPASCSAVKLCNFLLKKFYTEKIVTVVLIIVDYVLTEAHISQAKGFYFQGTCLNCSYCGCKKL